MFVSYLWHAGMVFIIYWSRCIMHLMVFHVVFSSILCVKPYYVCFVLRIPEISSRIRSLGFLVGILDLVSMGWLEVDGMIEGLEVSFQHQTSQNIRENLSSGQATSATSHDLPQEITFQGNLGWWNTSSDLVWWIVNSQKPWASQIGGASNRVFGPGNSGRNIELLRGQLDST